MNAVIEAVTEHPGIRQRAFEQYVNMNQGKIKQCIKYLTVNGDMYIENKKYYKIPLPWQTQQEEMEMNEYGIFR